MRQEKSRFTKVSLYLITKIVLNLVLLILAVFGWTYAIIYKFPSTIDNGGKIFDSMLLFVSNNILVIIGLLILFIAISLFVTYFFFHEQFTYYKMKTEKVSLRTGRIVGDLLVKLFLMMIIIVVSFPISSLTTEIVLNNRLKGYYEDIIQNNIETDIDEIITNIDGINIQEESLQDNGVKLSDQDLHNIYLDSRQCEFAIVEDYLLSQQKYSEFVRKDILSMSDINELYYIGNERNYYDGYIVPYVISWIFDVQVINNIDIPANYSYTTHTCLSDISHQDLAALGPIINEIAFRRAFENIDLSVKPEYFLLVENEYIAKRKVETQKLIEEYDLIIASNQEILTEIYEFRAKKDYTISIMGVEYWNEFEERLNAVEIQANNNIEKTESIKAELVESDDEIGAEAGIFLQPKTINIAYVDSDENINRFITFMHEYLHYASYITSQLTQEGEVFSYSNEEKAYSGDWNGEYLELFYEEAMTEILADKMLVSLSNNGYETGEFIQNLNQSYYPISGLLDFLYSKDPSINEKAYFTKDLGSEEVVFDTVYGEGFYAANYELFYVIFDKIYYYDSPFSAEVNELLKNMSVDESCYFDESYGFSFECIPYL